MKKNTIIHEFFFDRLLIQVESRVWKPFKGEILDLQFGWFLFRLLEQAFVI